MNFRLPEAVVPIVRFSVHVCLGALAFLLTFWTAVLVAFCIKLAEVHELTPGWLTVSASYVEMALWALDLIIFGVFLISEIIRFITTLREP